MLMITVSAEVVEVEEHELDSDAEPVAAETLKLTARGRPAHSPVGPRRRSRDETKKEIQEDDEATLRELLIRYLSVFRSHIINFIHIHTFNYQTHLYYKNRQSSCLL